MVICPERGADCFHIVQLMPLPSQNPSSLDSFKSRLVLPFWYRLTRVVLEKRQLNGWSVVVVVKGMKNGNRSTINWIRVSRSVPVTKRADYY